MKQVQDKLDFPVEVISDNELHDRFADALDEMLEEEGRLRSGFYHKRPHQDVVKTVPSKD